MQNINNAFFSGKIHSMFMTPKGELKLKLSITQSKPGKDGERVIKTDKDGNPMRSVITIRFLGESAKRVNENYCVGDYVNITALAQTVRNHYSCTNKIEMWGLSVNSKRNSQLSPLKDINNITLQGKVSSVYELKSGAKLVTVYTKVERPVLTPSLTPKPQSFISYTVVNVGKDFDCKKGDHIKVSGFVTEVSKKNAANSIEQHIICTNKLKYVDNTEVVDHETV